MSAAVESAIDVTIDVWRVEACYPADAATTAALDRASMRTDSSEELISRP